MRNRVLAAVIVLTSVASASAQQPPMPGGGMASVSQSTMLYYTLVKDWLMKSAAAMPEADYAFRPPTMPAPDKAQPRTFGQLIGHVADANYMFCGAAGAMAGGMGDIEKSKTTKADLQKALADSFAFCDKVWASTTDQNAMTMVKFPAGVPLPPMNRIGALAFNTSHEAEHYGNVVTYLRLKGHVPPSSQAMPAR
jgi:uncharacterized damage-inducible protein DinB